MGLITHEMYAGRKVEWPFDSGGDINHLGLLVWSITKDEKEVKL